MYWQLRCVYRKTINLTRHVTGIRRRPTATSCAPVSLPVHIVATERFMTVSTKGYLWVVLLSGLLVCWILSEILLVFPPFNCYLAVM